MKKTILKFYEKSERVTENEFNSLRILLDKMSFFDECENNRELLVLRGHLAVEFFLNRTIEEFLTNGSKLTRDNQLSFSKKMLVVGGFDVLEKDTYGFIKELNKLRNKCAHKISYRVSGTDINSLGNILPKKIFSKLKKKDNNRTLVNLLSSVLIDIENSIQLMHK